MSSDIDASNKSADLADRIPMATTSPTVAHALTIVDKSIENDEQIATIAKNIIIDLGLGLVKNDDALVKGKQDLDERIATAHEKTTKAFAGIQQFTPRHHDRGYELAVAAINEAIHVGKHEKTLNEAIDSISREVRKRRDAEASSTGPVQKLMSYVPPTAKTKIERKQSITPTTSTVIVRSKWPRRTQAPSV